MGLLKKFGFWSLAVFLITLITIGTGLLFKRLQVPAFSLTGFFLLVTLALSITGLIKDKSKILSIISFILSGLCVIAALYILFFARPHSAGMHLSCIQRSGICQAGSCDYLQSKGGAWAESSKEDGKKWGCLEGEVCCENISDWYPVG